jgi:hypothetical protein
LLHTVYTLLLHRFGGGVGGDVGFGVGARVGQTSTVVQVPSGNVYWQHSEADAKR